jgi:hypothetical protein
MASEFSTNYNDTAGWKLHNDFTIHEAKQLKDRPYMRTCVPKRIPVELSNMRAVDSVEWIDRFARELMQDKSTNSDSNINDNTIHNGYRINRYILADGVFKDKITVFNLEQSAIAQYKEFNHIRISPLPKGEVGGVHGATTGTAIGYSGMSSRNVPENGLMQGEPGYIWWDDESDKLEAYLFINEDEFDSIFSSLKAGVDKISSASLDLVAELFEDELQSFGGERWMSLEYGFLKRQKLSSTRARLESMSLVFSNAKNLNEKFTASLDENYCTKSYTEKDFVQSDPSLKNIERFVKAIFWAIVVFMITISFRL